LREDGERRVEGMSKENVPREKREEKQRLQRKRAKEDRRARNNINSNDSDNVNINIIINNNNSNNQQQHPHVESKIHYPSSVLLLSSPLLNNIKEHKPTDRNDNACSPRPDNHWPLAQ